MKKHCTILKMNVKSFLKHQVGPTIQKEKVNTSFKKSILKNSFKPFYIPHWKIKKNLYSFSVYSE